MIAPRPAFVLFGLAVGFAAPVPMSAVAAVAGTRTITVTDQARRAVNELYVSPVGSKSWGNTGWGRPPSSPEGAGGCDWTACRAATWTSRLFTTTLAMKNGTAWTSAAHAKTYFDGSAAVVPPAAKGRMHQVVLINASPRPIQQVLIAPADAGDWGDDLLPDGSLSAGERTNVTYHGDCLADLRVVFDNRSAEERRNLDLCGLHGVIVRPGWTTADALTPLPAPAAGRHHGDRGHRSRPVRPCGKHLFVFPQGSAERGPDLLAAQSLENSRDLGVTLNRPAGTCRFAAHVVYGGDFSDRDVSELDLCQNPTIVVPPPL